MRGLHRGAARDGGLGAAAAESPARRSRAPARAAGGRLRRGAVRSRVGSPGARCGRAARACEPSISGLRGLHERELQTRARVGAGAHALHRLAEQLEQPHDGGAASRAGPARAARASASAVSESSAGTSPSSATTSSSRARTSRSRANGGRRRGRSRRSSRAPERALRRRRAATASTTLLEQAGIGHAEHGEHVLERDLAAAVGDELLERAERVAEAAGRRARERGDGRGRDLDRLGLDGDAAHHAGDLLDGGAVEVEAVAAVDDGRGHLLGLGRGEHEDGVRAAAPRASSGTRSRPRSRACAPRRGCRPCVRPLTRRVGDALAQLADVVDGVVGGGVHLDHVERAGARDRDARLADAAGLDGRAPARSSGRRRGSSPSRSCRCRASRRTGRRGGPCPRSTALRSVRTTGSWPTTSAKVRGRCLR